MLSGIRVIDFSKYLPGPYATMRLADKGAEVIVVEPIEGEPSRHIGIKKNETGLLYLANNRNKKSIAIDLKSEEGQEVALQLMKTADVVVESFRPTVMKRLGLDYETVKKEKEDIIYCSISGYGQCGEMEQLGSHDLNYLAISGVLAQLKDEDGKPITPSVQLADHLGAFQCTEEVLAAIIRRNQTQEGTYIDLSLTDPLVSIMGTNYVHYRDGGVYRGVPELNGDLICYSNYKTKDGRYIALAALEHKFWKNFCEAVGKEEWIVLHGTNKKDNVQFYQQITEFFESRTLVEWTNFSFEVDCCMAPILEVDEINNFPFLKDRQLISENAANTNVSTFYLQKSSICSDPPIIGEHTNEVLNNLLGYSRDKIEDLYQKQIVNSTERTARI
ncbi:hypothetical protein BKP35_11910 [Anaerobacillus arseniciselenatis]|uniref:CoA transferase n=1 Tax=Anaerobacillus arseniciselenatis TaxID=85682 RepID=A0A1S2LGY0_9BACI|nr:CaiB/BaiF CoA-transferase family protein [Anaerobacillus arseniciselenatis]OIJ11636.1 hypothetical protein BKP35_11910 [Anaerobacillus arseniciselenatis]